MNRTPLLAAALAAALLAGCAADGGSLRDESELTSRIRQELALDPMLNTSRLTVTERDGDVVIGGFVDDLSDLQAIQEVVEGVDGVQTVENNVTIEGGGG